MRCNAYYDARFDVSTSHMGKCLTSLLSLYLSTPDPACIAYFAYSAKLRLSCVCILDDRRALNKRNTCWSDAVLICRMVSFA
jgi:hypothetical protein